MITYVRPSSGRAVGWLVCHNYLKVWKVSLPMLLLEQLFIKSLFLVVERENIRILLGITRSKSVLKIPAVN